MPSGHETTRTKYGRPIRVVERDRWTLDILTLATLASLLGVRILFHHIPNSAAEPLLDVLRRAYSGDELLALYDESDTAPPEPSTLAFAQLFASMDPGEFEKVRCIAGHSVQFALPVLAPRCKAVTLLRDPVQRVLSLFDDLRAGRGRHGESPAGELIRARGWSLLDIYQTYGGLRPSTDGEQHLFADFFNGQARAILAPHFPVDWLPLDQIEPGPELPVSESLSRITAEHYLLGSSSRFAASVDRFAGALGWSLGDEAVAAAEPEADITQVPEAVLETVRSYNRLDQELVAGVLRELGGDESSELPHETASDTQPLSAPDDPEHLASRLAEERAAHNRALGALSVRDDRLRAMTDKVEQAERALTGALERIGELEVRLKERDRELAAVRGELARLGDAGRQLAAQLDRDHGERTDQPGAAAEASDADAQLLEVTLERARRALLGAEEERIALARRLEARAAELQAAGERGRGLAASVERLETELDEARSRAEQGADAVDWLMAERNTMVRYAHGLAESRAWRYGHGVSRMLGLLTFRRSAKPAGAAEVLLAMLETQPLLEPGSEPQEPPPSGGGGQSAN